MVTALIVKPGCIPCEIQLDTDLQSLEKAVSLGTGMECSVRLMDLEKGVTMIHAWEGLSLGLPGNRRVKRRIIPGVFYVLGKDEDQQFRSLTEDEVRKYTKKYWNFRKYSEEEMINSWFDGLWLML